MPPARSRERDWNGIVIDGEVTAGVSRLKEDLDGDLMLIGGGELARHLVADSLVDELRFWMHPFVWGKGQHPFEGREQLRLSLIEAKAFDSGVTLLRYEPAGRS